MKTCSQIIIYDFERENCLFYFIFSGYMIISIHILIYIIIRMTSFRYFQICTQICMCDIQKITHIHTHTHTRQDSPEWREKFIFCTSEKSLFKFVCDKNFVIVYIGNLHSQSHIQPRENCLFLMYENRFSYVR